MCFTSHYCFANNGQTCALDSVKINDAIQGASKKLWVKRISCGYVPGTGLRCFGRADNDQPVPGT